MVLLSIHIPITTGCVKKGRCQMKFIDQIENDKFNIEVHECDCGFHFGVDVTYLDQVGDVNFLCPSCEQQITISGYEGGEP